MNKVVIKHDYSFTCFSLRVLSIVNLRQPRSQHCLSTALAQAVGFSTLIGCNLNEESVRKILETQLRYEISNGLKLHLTKDQLNVLPFTRKQLLDNEMFKLGCSWAGKENKKYRT